MVLSRDNVRVISAAGDVEIVGADTIAKLSAETSEDRPPADWDQRIVIRRTSTLGRRSTNSLSSLSPKSDPPEWISMVLRLGKAAKDSASRSVSHG